VRSLVFKQRSFDELHEWIRTDRKSYERIYRILQEYRRTPFQGIGKPEALKGALQGFWSRRVNDEDRIVYEVTATEIIVHSLRGHYQ
jgi:toxin YoeB